MPRVVERRARYEFSLEADGHEFVAVRTDGATGERVIVGRGVDKVAVGRAVEGGRRTHGHEVLVIPVS